MNSSRGEVAEGVVVLVVVNSSVNESGSIVRYCRLDACWCYMSIDNAPGVLLHGAKLSPCHASAPACH